MPITPAAFPATHLVDTARASPQAARAISAEHARLVAQSWSIAAARPDVLAAAFYAHLLALDPSLRLLFLGESPEQARERGRRLVHTLGVAVANLHRFPERGEHAPGGVAWDTVGASLFAALDAVLGMAFTPSLREAWQSAYGAIAGAMRAASGNSASGMAA